MNTRIKLALMAAGVAAGMTLPLSGQASDGTITFTGAVTASTCAINVNGAGSANATVPLPIVSTAALTDAATKKTAAGTFFNIAVGTCATAADVVHAPAAAAAPTTVQIYFEAGPNVDQTTGGLINTAAGSNVEVNLYNASGSTIVGTQILPGVIASMPAAQTISTTAATGTQWFYAGYSTAANGGAAATAGAVSTSVTYSLVYY